MIATAVTTFALTVENATLTAVLAVPVEKADSEPEPAAVAVPEETTVEDVNIAAKEMASYKRPSHVVILDQGGIPLNRVAKTDYKTLTDMAEKATEQLRAQGKWDVE